MADPGGLHVRGGAGGVAAHLDDLEHAGRLLRETGRELGGLGAAAVRLATGTGARVGVLSAPVTWASTEFLFGAATVGPHGLLRLAAEIEATGLAVGAAARAYRGADEAASAALPRAEQMIGHAAGLLLGRAMLDPGFDAPVVVVGVALTSAPGPARRILPEVLRRSGILVLGLLARHAGLTERLLPAVPAVAEGASEVLPTAWLTSPGAARSRPRSATSADLAARIATVGAELGRLRGRVWLNDAGSVTVSVPVRTSRTARPATGLGDLLERIPPTSTAAPRIRIEQVRHPDGSLAWVVSVPGTANWSPVPGSSPFDLTGDVQLMAGERSAGTSAVLAAMRSVGVRKGEPVLLVGHSQGGLIAATVAADPRVRREFSVTQVLTTGAPIASIPVPDSVQVLALEHTDDLVPRLDARPNPDRAHWITVSSPTPSSPTQTRSSRALAAHLLTGYQSTAVELDGCTDPSIARWRQAASIFLDGPHRQDTVWQVDVSRVPRS